MEKVLIANQQEVTRLLPMTECIEVMTKALTALANGDGLMPLRTMMRLPGSQNLMGLMPSYQGSIQSLGVKVIAVFPSNHGTEYDAHQGVVILFDSEYGVLRAILDGTAITAIRTAAVSAVATRLLALEDAGDLAIIGAGTQAHTHLEAMGVVRRLRRVRVFSLPVEGAYIFAERETRSLAQRGYDGLKVEVMVNAAQATADADLICTTTTAREPVLHGEWISPGAHINAVGAFTPTTRELDTQAVVQACLFVDRREVDLIRGRGVHHPQIRGPHRRRAYPRRVRRAADRKSAGSPLCRRDHIVQVSGSCHRRSGGRPSHLTKGAPDQSGNLVGNRRASLRQLLRDRLNANDQSAQFIASSRWENLPAPVQQKAPMCLAAGGGAGRWRDRPGANARRLPAASTPLSAGAIRIIHPIALKIPRRHGSRKF